MPDSAVYVCSESWKEALNGFADAQAAVRTPPGLCPVTAATPGAPPSYDDVLKEDSRRLRDDPPRPSRQPSAQGTSSPSHPLTASHDSDPRPCPAHTMTSATHSPSSRIRSNSSGDSKIEKLVDVRDTTSGEPTAYPPVASSRTSLKPILISAMRPKSSYHPLSQLVPPMSLPPAASFHVSLPPPLLPVSIPPASPLPIHCPTPPLTLTQCWMRWW
ncbi:hypothetical protein GWK47_017513 [Chionoecetes opilio]|uniref:Uncharacterized protein n=1 Tax=Chionoecetes opilio TaxID=41210 RepID=A0A8J5CH35_CHIOP|nr:hypothetical protein GWK47_017513 [Chionoecetes opilio]